MEIYVCVVIILLIYGYISYKLLCDIVNLKKSIIQVKKRYRSLKFSYQRLKKNKCFKRKS